jgi:hypothetical protein
MAASKNLLSDWQENWKNKTKFQEERFFAAQKELPQDRAPLDMGRPNSKSPTVERP